MSATMKQRLPLTQEVLGRLRDRLAEGSIGSGQYLPSERELCRELSVSRFTVRRALDRLVSEGLITREPARGYLIRKSGASVSSKLTSRGIAFLHSHPESELLGHYHGRLWAGARAEADSAGARVLISSVHGEAPAAEKAETLRAMISGALCDVNDEGWIEALLAAGLQVVRVDHLPISSEARELDAVIQDDWGGISLALCHLHERGHRRMGYLDPTASVAFAMRGNAARRLGAFVGECRRLGIHPGEGAIQEVRGGDADVAAACERVLQSGVTALVIPFNVLLPGARAALQMRGISLRGDFGLVVWGEPGPGDDQADYPSYVTWSKERMGREGVRRLLARLERPDLEPVTMVIPTRLVDRGTSGRVPEAE